MKTIRKGDSGPDVVTWQKIVGAEPDGDFGAATETASKAWQKLHGLEDDGVVGGQTWAAAGVTGPAPASAGGIAFVPAKNFTRASRGIGKITAVVIHTAECGEVERAAENVAGYFAGAAAPKASAHYTVDADSIVQSVRDEDIAWHAGPVNDWSIGIEHAGYAKQDSADWADAYSTAMLERSAELVAGLCVRWSIPVKRLTGADLARGERRGIFGHVDVTMGLTRGLGHSDPGASFPWAQYLALVQQNVDALSHVELSANTERAPDGDGEPPPGRVELVTTSEGFVEVAYDGAIWLVQPVPAGFVSIGEAEALAKKTGCELPSPGLVDAIWRAADLRISPAETIQAHDGTLAGMNAKTIYTNVATAIASATAGQEFTLLAGAFKDVVVKDGKVGLYGWHVDDPSRFRARLLARLGTSVPLHAPATPGEGSVVQPFFSGHAREWRDYSQSVRLVKQKT